MFYNPRKIQYIDLTFRHGESLHRWKLVAPCCVCYLERADRLVGRDDLSVRVLDGGDVVLFERVVDEPQDQACLTHACTVRVKNMQICCIALSNLIVETLCEYKVLLKSSGCMNEILAIANASNVTVLPIVIQLWSLVKLKDNAEPISFTSPCFHEFSFLTEYARK